MTKHNIYDLNGAECLPKEKELQFNSSQEEMRRLGFNDATTELRKVAVEFDKDKVIEIISNLRFREDITSFGLSDKAVISIVNAIASQKDVLKLTRENG